jgi:hypothetical protein
MARRRPCGYIEVKSKQGDRAAVTSPDLPGLKTVAVLAVAITAAYVGAMDGFRRSSSGCGKKWSKPEGYYFDSRVRRKVPFSTY